MSIEYVRMVSILKLIEDPALALMSVAKPWMSESPAPSMSHVLSSATPTVCEFSQATGFTVAPQDDAADAGAAHRVTEIKAAIRTATAKKAMTTGRPETRSRPLAGTVDGTRIVLPPR